MVTMWFEGIEELYKLDAEFHRASERIGDDGEAVLRASAFQVEAAAKVFCPVDTGHLKGTIGPPSFDGHAGLGAMSAEVAATAKYARYVEWGTRNMAPQPYMGPALDRVAPYYVAACMKIADPLGGGGLAGRSGGGRG